MLGFPDLSAVWWLLLQLALQAGINGKDRSLQILRSLRASWTIVQRSQGNVWFCDTYLAVAFLKQGFAIDLSLELRV